MNPYEAYIRAYIISPQTLEAAKRAIKLAVGSFLLAVGAALMEGETDWRKLLGIGLSAAAGAFGVRTYEGVKDTKRQLAGNVIDADVKPLLPARVPVAQ